MNHKVFNSNVLLNSLHGHHQALEESLGVKIGEIAIYEDQVCIEVTKGFDGLDSDYYKIREKIMGGLPRIKEITIEEVYYEFYSFEKLGS
jgi:hypothetical protein